MFNTIFRKQFFFYAATLTVSFSLIALVLVSVFQSYFVSRTSDSLVEQGTKLANSFVRYAQMPTPSRETQLLNDIETLNILGASCILTSPTGQVIVNTQDITSLTIGQTINAPDIQGVFDGKIVRTQGTLSGIFSETVLTVAYPIIVQPNTLVGVVLMNASMADVQKTTFDVIRMTVQCLLVSLVLSFVLVYIMSKTISRPIYQINQAAKEIASGDFEKRLTVKSRDEVGQLAASFNNMAESLEHQEKTRREFIANISHDLRSPLTSMRGFLQAILDGTIPPEGRDKYLHIVLNESERLSKLANDILDISKIQTLEVELVRTKFDINELIRKAIILFEPRITGKTLHVDVSFADERNIVFADEEKIQRVVNNLLDNAVKFTEPGGHIAVETSAKNGIVKVSISDDGRGISEAEQKHIFERFYKADASRGEDKTGSGLGLSIVRAFIKAHGEAIFLESEPGQGCTFTFTLTEA